MIDRVRDFLGSPRAAAAGMGMVLLLLGLPTLWYPFGRDQAMFAYVGAVLREGGLPYRDAWDVKPPGIFLVYAAIGAREWGPRVADLAGLGAAAWLLAREKAAGPAAGILLLLFSLGACDYWNLAQAETLLVPISVAAVLLALRGRLLGAGLLAGIGITLKTTSALLLVPLLVASLTCSGEGHRGAPNGRRRAAEVLLGAVAAPAAVGLWIVACGGAGLLSELLAAQWEYARGDPRLAARSLADAVRLLGLPGYLPLVAASTAALPVWLAGAEDRRTRLVVACWWGAALLQVLLQRRFYLYHWAVFTPPAAWLVAWALGRLRDRLAPVPSTRRVLALGVLLAGAWVVRPRVETHARWLELVSGGRSVDRFRASFRGVFDYSVAASTALVARIRLGAVAGDRLQVLAFEPQLYLWSGLRPPGRHASTAPLFGETAITLSRRRAWARELSLQLQAAPPRFVVTRPGDAWPPWARDLSGWVPREYFPVFHAEGMVLWQRRRPVDGPPPPQ